MLKSFYSQFTDAVCRVCLDNENTMIPLFDVSSTDSKEISYADMLNKCAEVYVMDGDNLPAHICQSCRDSLINSYKFKQLAEQSNAILLQRSDVKPKTVFQNLGEFKLKIEDTGIVNNSTTNLTADQPNISRALISGSIGNTFIHKVKSECLSDSDMEVEYLEDDFFKSSPPKKNQKKNLVKKPQTVRKTNVTRNVMKSKPGKAINIIAPIKGLKVNPPDYSKYGSLKNPIPIKMSDEWKMKEILKSVKRKASEGLSVSVPIILNKDVLPLHEAKVKEKKEKKLQEKVKHVCSICGLQTFTLKAHLLTHAEHKPFKCEHCTKSFAQKGNYTLHMKKHTGVRDQVCDICGATFYLSKSVKRHKMIHTQDKKFACHLCPKKFYVNCDLTRHLKVHSGYKPFSCETCSMMFNAKHQLDAHKRMHTGEKPYTCEICNVAFTYKVNLNNHVAKIHGVNLKFKSIYKITPDVLSDLFKEQSENMSGKIIQSDPTE